MRKFLKVTRNNSGASAIIVNGVTLLPFAGLALLLNCEGWGMALGIIMLTFGLFMWTRAYK